MSCARCVSVLTLIMYTQSQMIEKANYLKVFVSKTTKYYIGNMYNRLLYLKMKLVIDNKIMLQKIRVDSFKGHLHVHKYIELLKHLQLLMLLCFSQFSSFQYQLVSEI